MWYLCSMSFKINWDAIGISTSLACAIHCALLPLFFTSLPIFGINIVHNLFFEYAMIALAMVVGTYSLYHGKRKHHHNWWPFRFFVVGMILLLLKVTFPAWEIMLLVPAVIGIIAAHALNFRLCRQHNHAHSDDCNH